MRKDGMDRDVFYKSPIQNRRLEKRLTVQGRAGSACLMERTFWPALFPNTSLFDLFLGIFMCSTTHRTRDLIPCLCFNNKFVVSIRTIHNVKCNLPIKGWPALFLGTRLNWTEFGCRFKLNT